MSSGISKLTFMAVNSIAAIDVKIYRKARE